MGWTVWCFDIRSIINNRQINSWNYLQSPLLYVFLNNMIGVRFRNMFCLFFIYFLG
ncbi:hypothetical protein HanPSC8_Chr04g0143081 [Helianthus annuus]|nr:hypothetical protein HanPSC8_Chr04g0143081 [Helianthus annuus]